VILQNADQWLAIPGCEATRSLASFAPQDGADDEEDQAKEPVGRPHFSIVRDVERGAQHDEESHEQHQEQDEHDQRHEGGGNAVHSEAGRNHGLPGGRTTNGVDVADDGAGRPG